MKKVWPVVSAVHRRTDVFTYANMCTDDESTGSAPSRSTASSAMTFTIMSSMFDFSSWT